MSSFEENIEKIKNIISKLESGELSIEENLSLFEEGLKLSTECQNRLKEADMKVKKIVERAGKLFTEEIQL